MVQTNIDELLEQKIGNNRIKRNIILAPYTTFKMGGPAEFYFEAESEQDLITAVQAAQAASIPITILGGASNVVISHRGIQGLVVRNRYIEKKITSDHSKYVLLHVSSGYSMTRLAKETAEAGFSGLEYHIGLPGTVGGAIYMNSKWTNPVCYVGDLVNEAKLVDKKGKVKTVAKNYFAFAYDSSILQRTREILLSVTFKLKKTEPKLLVNRGKAALEYRKKTQPFGVATSGCFFRNINGQSAGELVDRAGLKGFKIGGAQVSNRHANFILNNKATFEDVQSLVAHIKKIIKQKYHLKLAEEVLYL